MKSTTMIQQLDQAHANGTKIDADMLDYFVTTGSDRLRRHVVQLLHRRSTATSLFDRIKLFKFLLEMMDESNAAIDLIGFTDDCLFFLFELRESKISADRRRGFMQQYLNFIEGVISHDLSGRRTIGNVLIDRLDRIFPNIERDKSYTIGPNVKEYIKDKIPANCRPYVPGF